MKTAEQLYEQHWELTEALYRIARRKYPTFPADRQKYFMRRLGVLAETYKPMYDRALMTEVQNEIRG